MLQMHFYQLPLLRSSRLPPSSLQRQQQFSAIQTHLLWSHCWTLSSMRSSYFFRDFGSCGSPGLSQQWQRNELAKDSGGPIGNREKMAIPSALVGKDARERAAREFETKQLLKSAKPGKLQIRVASWLRLEGFTLSPLPIGGPSTMRGCRICATVRLPVQPRAERQCTGKQMQIYPFPLPPFFLCHF